MENVRWKGLAGFPNAVIWLQYTCLVHCQSSSTSTEDVSPLEVCWFTRGTGTNGGALSDPNGRFRMLGVGGGSLVGSITVIFRFYQQASLRTGLLASLRTERSDATNGAPGRTRSKDATNGRTNVSRRLTPRRLRDETGRDGFLRRATWSVSGN